MSMQVALIYASNNARAALAEQVKASVRSLTHNYVKSLNKNMTEDMELRFEQLTVTVVNQELQNSNPVCKEAKKFNRNGKLMYKYYVVMDMSKDALLQPLHQALSADDIANVDMDYNTFKVEFEKEFANQIETNVQ